MIQQLILIWQVISLAKEKHLKPKKGYIPSLQT